MEQSMKSFLHNPGRGRIAFTVIELLVVVSIAAALMCVSVAAFNSVANNIKLTSGGDTVIAQFNLARQTAIGRNCQVEFRIYQLPDTTSAGAVPSQYRAFQIFSLDKGGTQTNAITQARFLPSSVHLVPTTTASSILNIQEPPYAVSGTQAGTSFATYKPSAYNYIAFHCNPDGSTDLDPTRPWFFSIALKNDPVQGNEVPRNFITILIEPLSGRARMLSPN